MKDGEGAKAVGFAKELYDVRSAVVHGGKKDVTKVTAARFEWFAFMSLRKAAEKAEERVEAAKKVGLEAQ